MPVGPLEAFSTRAFGDSFHILFKSANSFPTSSLMKPLQMTYCICLDHTVLGIASTVTTGGPNRPILGSPFYAYEKVPPSGSNMQLNNALLQSAACVLKPTLPRPAP